MANVQASKITINDASQTLELEAQATETNITSSVTRVVIQRDGAGGRTDAVVKSSGNFDANLKLERSFTANATLEISQKPTTAQIIPGTANTAIIVNPANLDVDFIARGVGAGLDADNLLRVDAGNNNVGVGTIATDASAKLQVDSTTQGFLPPRMNTTERDAISSAATGLIIYNTSTECLEYYTGSTWLCLSSSSSGLRKKSWSFTTPSGASGIFYVGGYYEMGSVADDFSPSINFGVANNPYAAHFFIVLGSAPVDTLTIRVSGTSINDSGVRVTSDTEDIVVDTGDSINDYFETPKKWLGQISVSIVAGTPVSCNYGFSKYWDNANNDFVIKGWHATWVGGANDSGANLEVIHHKATGWTYNALSEASPPSPIESMAGDFVTESDIANNQPGAWKRTDISESVLGSGEEGFILRIITTANKAFELGNFILSITG